ncbi:hypothetical protein NC661_19810 [Aquibacillus koreensis]|uniref:Uncharacterized protein n=1 Tax=Aquibacillus koreensis TaxID=279446 RepID=A0A9X4AJU9_9BACI|nr:hypothetical protein [Aquibacillus koreensis]MCT2536648.1 hypothetical protein [Aquibacillus koreensis]MDC3422602.1 hypothetical protein [Aquibacillus koreensis]
MRVIIFSILFTILLSIGNCTSATSWGKVPPDKVRDRADVIVVGEFNFAGETADGEFIFYGQEFNVDYVYKGENVSKDLIVGIDMLDGGWEQEFQQKGGKFLLLLEYKPEYGDFPVPVAGPNGMIRVINGEVSEEEKHKNHYNKFLDENTPFYVILDGKTERNIVLLIFITISGTILIVGNKMFKKYSRKKT